MTGFLNYFSRKTHSAKDANMRMHDPIRAHASEEPGVISNIGGRNYHLISDDKYLHTVKGVFEPDTVKLFDSLVSPNDTVLDVGANIGCTTILFADRARKVYSFEPSPSTFQFLQKNIDTAQLENVSLVNLGLGREAGRFDLTFSGDNRSGGFVSNKLRASAGHNVESIEIVCGDSYVENNQIRSIDFIKIDVEGFEKDVLQGLSNTIQRCRPTVALELNHWCLNAFQRISVPDFFDFLRQIFPYLYAVEKEDIRNIHDVDEAYHVMYHHIVTGFKYPNLVGAFNASQLKRFGEAYGRKID